MTLVQCADSAKDRSRAKELLVAALREELHGTLDRAILLLREACADAAGAHERAEAHFQLGRMLSLQRGADGKREPEARRHFHEAMVRN